MNLDTPEETLDPWDEVTDRLDSAARARALISAVRKLPSAERDVLLLVAWEQMTPAEAAVALSIPPGTARSRLHRARATLREMVAEADANEAEVRSESGPRRPCPRVIGQRGRSSRPAVLQRSG